MSSSDDLSRLLHHARPLRSARQPAHPRHDDLRRGLGLGRQPRGLRSDPRRVPRPRWQHHRHRQHLHQRTLREDRRRLPRRPARPPRARRAQHEVLRQPPSRRPQRWRRWPQGADRPAGGFAAPPADRLRRPLLAAQLGPARADRGNDPRARRSRRRRQGPLRRPLRRPPPGSPRRRRRSPASVAGRRSPRCNSSTRCSSARPKASCCRWPRSSASA